jgi:hypothetical protein
MIVSYIKSCYTAKVRFFRDSDREDTVYWYFTSPDAREFPFYSRFCTGDFVDSRVGDWPGPGEVKGTKQWRRGVNPWGLDGTCRLPLGDPEWWARGVPLGSAGPVVRPSCCAMHPVVLPAGGLAAGAAAQTDQFALTALPTGGAAAGAGVGIARIALPLGGLAGGAGAGLLVDRVYAPSGGAAAAGGVLVGLVYLPSGAAAAGARAGVVTPPRSWVYGGLGGAFFDDGILTPGESGDPDATVFVICGGWSFTDAGATMSLTGISGLVTLGSAFATDHNPYFAGYSYRYRNADSSEGVDQAPYLSSGTGIAAGLELGGDVDVVDSAMGYDVTFGSSVQTPAVSSPGGPWMILSLLVIKGASAVTTHNGWTVAYLEHSGDQWWGAAYKVHPSSGGDAGDAWVIGSTTTLVEILGLSVAVLL